MKHLFIGLQNNLKYIFHAFSNFFKPSVLLIIAIPWTTRFVSHPKAKYVRRVAARKMAETPQPMYVIKLRMVAWRRLVMGSLERS